MFTLRSLTAEGRLAVRSLRRSPGFTAVAVLTLALGIGLNAAMFSMANTFLLRTLPYPHAERLVRIFGTSPESRQWGFNYADYEALRGADTGLESIGAFHWWGGTLMEPGTPPDILPLLRATPEFLTTLGVRPLHGRWFTREEDHEAPDVVLISHSLWQRRFARAADIVGRTVHLNERQVTVIGVMPPDMAAPLVFGLVDFWEPLGLSTAERGYMDSLQVVARLRPDDSNRHANSVLQTVASRIARDTPRAGTPRSMRAIPLHASGSSDTATSVTWLIVGLSAAVLLIACANLANLQLARAHARTRDNAIRAALGADRASMLRPMLLESLVLAVLGGSVGLFLAWACNRWTSAHFRFWWGIGGQDFPIDGHVLVFTFGATLASALFFGTIPGSLAMRVNLASALKSGGRGTVGSKAGRRFRQILVVAEFALALVLLTGAGLLHHGVTTFMTRDVGWRTDGLAYGYLAASPTRHKERADHVRFYERLRERAATLPGVEIAVTTWQIPTWDFANLRLTTIEGHPASTPDQVPRMHYLGVSPGFLRALDIPLMAGRDFDAHDIGDDAARSATERGRQVAIINETTARTFWPGESPLGRRISFNDEKGEPWWIEIVGVAGDVRFPGNLNPPVTRFQVYRPVAQEPWAWGAVVMRTSGDPRAIIEPFRRAMAEIEPGLPVAFSGTVADDIALSMANLRLTLQLLGAVALLGLFIAALGIHAVLAQHVVRRTPEIGVRLALGAQPRRVLGMVIGSGLQMAAIGATIGLFGAVPLTLLLKRLVPELPAADPWLVAALTAMLLTIALISSWLPARRAAHVNPVIALRGE